MNKTFNGLPFIAVLILQLVLNSNRLFASTIETAHRPFTSGAFASSSFGSSLNERDHLIKPLTLVPQRLLTELEHKHAEYYTSSEIIILDRGVPEFEKLLEHAFPSAQVHMISPHEDGVLQLKSILSNYHSLSAVHILSHGSEGKLSLGNSYLDVSRVEKDPELTTRLNQALVPGGDLMLYGCDLAATDNGKQLLHVLKAKTHADIAASDDKTGQPQNGGDWELEVQLGLITTDLPFVDLASADFSGVLAETTYVYYDFCDATANPAECSSPTLQMISDDGRISFSSASGVRTLSPRVQDDPGFYINEFGTGDSSGTMYFNAISDITSFELKAFRIEPQTSGYCTSASLTAFKRGGGSVSMTFGLGSGIPITLPEDVNSTLLSGVQISSFEINVSGCSEPAGFILAGTRLTIDKPLPPNNPPTNIYLSKTTFNQSHGNNAWVGDLSSQDPDTVDNHVYTLVSGFGSDDNASFIIDGNKLQAIDAAAMTRESYSVRIKTDDGSGGQYQKSFTIYLIDDVAPRINQVAVPGAGLYTQGQLLEFIVQTSETVNVLTGSGTPFLQLNIGGMSRQALYIQANGSNLTFRYNISAGDLDTDGISIVDLQLGGGAIRDIQGNSLVLTLQNVGDTTSVRVDTVAPPTPQQPDLTDASDSGTSQSDNITQDNTPTIIGQAEAGALIKLASSQSGLLGSTTADVSGDWSFTPTSSLSDGAYDLTVTATDVAGNNSAASPALHIVIDTLGPPVSAPDLAEVSDTGISQTDDITNVQAPQFNGTSENSAFIDLSSDLQGSLGSTLTDNSGTWSLIPVNTLSEGQHAIIATASDIAGNSSTSSVLLVTIDSQPPALSAPDLIPAADSGTSDSDNITQQLRPTFTGSAEKQANISLSSDQDGLVGSSTADASGVWVLIPDNDLSQGFHNLIAQAMDSAGNTSANSLPLGVTIDNTAPASPSTPDLDSSSDSGSSQSDNITNNPRPLLTGSAEIGAMVTVTSNQNGLIETVNVSASGLWSVQPGSDLSEGQHEIIAQATDVAGNQSADSMALPLTIDVTVPTINGVSFDQGQVDSSNAENISFTLSGAEISTEAEYRISSSTGAAEVTGNASVNIATQQISGLDVSSLNDGTLTLNLQLIDVAGNKSLSQTATISKDAQQPAITGINIAAGHYRPGTTLQIAIQLNEDINISGTSSTLDLVIGEQGILAHFDFEDNGILYYQHTVQNGQQDDDGIVLLANGIHLNGDTVTDAGGNHGILSFAQIHFPDVLVDSQSPQHPDSISLTTEQLTNQAIFSVTGSHQENQVWVRFFADNNNDGQPDSDQVVASSFVSQNQWSVQLPLQLNSINRFVLNVADMAGNVSQTLVLPVVTQDNIAPAPPVITSPISATSVTSGTISFTGSHTENGVTVSLFVDIDNDGEADKPQAESFVTVTNQQWVLNAPLYDGANNFVIAAKDPAGNQSTLVDTVTITRNSPPPGNNKPFIFGTPPATAQVGQSYHFQPVAYDPDDDALTFSISGIPHWATFDKTLGILTGSPSEEDLGVYAGIRISVSDGFTQSALPDFLIEVQASAIPPTGQDIALTTNEDNAVEVMPIIQGDVGKELSLNVVAPPLHGTLNPAGLGWHYQPNSDYFGLDTFSYQVTDGTLLSKVYFVVLQINPINDPPVGRPDNLLELFNPSNQYILDVLHNDIDADNDPLSVLDARISVGEISILNGNLLQWRAPQGFIGPAEFDYLLADPSGAFSQASGQIQIQKGTHQGPIFADTPALNVNARGLFTRISLSQPKAFDARGTELPVTLLESAAPYSPGHHQLLWQAIDQQGLTTTISQELKVYPLIALEQDRHVTEGSEVTLYFHLNGPSPEYPLAISYALGGSADASDHSLQAGTLQLQSGTEVSLTFQIVEDALDEGEETLIISLTGEQNSGYPSSTTLYIQEAQPQATASIKVYQNGHKRRQLSMSDGPVKALALLSRTDNVSIEWLAPDLENLSNIDSEFVFNPQQMTAGNYQLGLRVIDHSFSPAQTTEVNVPLQLFPSLPELGDGDTDDDLLPDKVEGYVDEDNDGIPDYLDNLARCNVMPALAGVRDQFLLESSPGVCLMRNTLSMQSSGGGLLLDNTLIKADPGWINIGGWFDFTLYALANVGQSHQIVIPLLLPVPERAHFRKWHHNRWQDFVEDSRNSLQSAKGEPGFCPPPGSPQYQSGLAAGHHCLLLTLQDGGPNDNDGLINGMISDPGGIAIVKTDNQAPVANDDHVELKINTTKDIRVLDNDSDPDGDTLLITDVLAQNGQAEIIGDALRYSPPINYVGPTRIHYFISDQKGGIAEAWVSIQVIANQPPLATDDEVSTDNQSKILIPVLSNDHDPDGDTLNIVSAMAANGDAEVTQDNMISYRAKARFVGKDIIFYSIKDESGAHAQAIVSVTVVAKPDEKPSTGAVIFYLLAILSAALWFKDPKLTD
ncbi:DUF4347 domain-containing protein [Bowmanella sp. Y26]|uniref:Ig-like domain-containing protein n=1 Tax=Bowmanella yangjiangensis TaxID=2811230 RepID=UPI001BDD385B|nr:Ig-like domain-containing protein [Bowmanella yangjiangensis]MBT1063356.1 DUF4347 domain-containing protein [Bowmanella yangjiangensis]